MPTNLSDTDARAVRQDIANTLVSLASQLPERAETLSSTLRAVQDLLALAHREESDAADRAVNPTHEALLRHRAERINQALIAALQAEFNA